MLVLFEFILAWFSRPIKLKNRSLFRHSLGGASGSHSKRELSYKDDVKESCFHIVVKTKSVIAQGKVLWGVHTIIFHAKRNAFLFLF